MGASRTPRAHSGTCDQISRPAAAFAHGNCVGKCHCRQGGTCRHDRTETRDPRSWRADEHAARQKRSVLDSDSRGCAMTMRAPEVESIAEDASVAVPPQHRSLGRFFKRLFSTNLDKGRGRIRIIALSFVCLFATINARLIYLGFKPDPQSIRRAAVDALSGARPDILDNVGIAGIEKYIDGQGLADLHNAGLNLTPDGLKPIQLSLDLRLTHGLRDEIAKGIEKYRAKAGAGAILDVNTGEVVALASLPDFDPNNPADALDPLHINRLAVG